MAAVIALSVLVMPYIVKTTEVALRQVPTALREGAAGLGISRTSTLGRVLLPTALPAIVSGLIVALAISTGELAPLLFTAGGGSDFNPTLHLFHHPVPYLTTVIYNDLSQPNQPGQNFHAASAAAGVMSLAILIVLILLGRLVARRARRNTARMSL
jgi:phosphate transport system permease protein